MKKKNYYAVKVGRIAGIYRTWAEAEAQVKGYPGAKHRGFSSLEEAVAFIEGDECVKVKTETKVKKNDNKKDLSLDDIYAFVDGSYNIDTSVYGYGGFLDVNGKRHYLSGSGFSKERNVAGELAGTKAAILKAKELGLNKLTIYYDYKGIGAWAPGGNWKAKGNESNKYQEFLDEHLKDIDVSFKKVTAHTGIEGNEIADVMAKNAAGIELTSAERKLLPVVEKDCTREVISLREAESDDVSVEF